MPNFGGYPGAYKAAAAAYAGFQSGSGAAATAAVEAAFEALEAAGPFAPIAAAFMAGFVGGWYAYDKLFPPKAGALPPGFGTLTKPGVAGWNFGPGWALCRHFSSHETQPQCGFVIYNGVGCNSVGAGPYNNNGPSCDSTGYRTTMQLGDKAAAIAVHDSYGSPFGDPGFWVTDVYENTAGATVVVTPTYSPTGAPAVPMDVAPGAIAGAIPDYPWPDGVRAPPRGWPWAWPPGLGADVRGVGLPDVSAPDLIGVDAVPGLWGGVPIAQSAPGVRDVVTVLPVGVPVARVASPAMIAPQGSELKVKSKHGYKLIALLAVTTEARDAVQALWKALPKGCKSKFKTPKGGRRHLTLGEMVQDLAACFRDGGVKDGDAFAKQAIKNLISNELEDLAYGKGGQKFKEATERLRKKGYFGDVGGLQSGSAFRPHNNRGETPFDWIANHVVDAVW